MWKSAILSAVLFTLILTQVFSIFTDFAEERENCIIKCSSVNAEPKFNNDTGVCTCVVLKNIHNERLNQNTAQSLNFRTKAESPFNNLRKRRHIPSNGNHKHLSHQSKDSDPIVGQAAAALPHPMAGARTRFRESMQRLRNRNAANQAGSATQTHTIQTQIRSFTDRIGNRERARAAAERIRVRNMQNLQRLNALNVQNAARAQQRARTAGVVGSAPDKNSETAEPQNEQKANGQSGNNDPVLTANGDHSIITQPKETMED